MAMGLSLILLINLIIYYRVCEYGYICDDVQVKNSSFTDPLLLKRQSLQTNEVIEKDRKLVFKERPMRWRDWVQVYWQTFLLEFRGKKYFNHWRVHLYSFIIHTSVCMGIYIMFGHGAKALISALIFAVHPILTQASVWPAGKPYAISALLVILMFIFPQLAILLFLLGNHYYALNNLFSPLVFMITPYWYFSAIVIVGLFREIRHIFTPKFEKFTAESNAELKRIHPKKFILAFKIYGYYFVQCIWPMKLTLYHPFLFTHGISKKDNEQAYRIEHYFFCGVILFLVTCFCGWMTIFHKQYYNYTFGLLWYSFNIAMWTNIITMNQTIALRYVYLPAIGAVWVLANLVASFPLVIVGILVWYFVRLWYFLPHYKSEYSSLEYACIETPDLYYVWLNRAVNCYQGYNYHGALANLLRAHELKPDDFKVNMNIAQIYIVVGNIKEAEKFYNLAKECTIDGREEQIAGILKRKEELLGMCKKAAVEGKGIELDLSTIEILR